MRKPEELTQQIENFLDQEIEPFPTSVLSVFGQHLEIISGEEWAKELNIEVVGHTTKKIYWGFDLHPDPYIDWILRSWVIDRARGYIDFNPFADNLSILSELRVHDFPPEKVEAALFSKILSGSAAAVAAGKNDTLTSYRSLYRWCLDEGLPGFSEYHDLQISNIKPQRSDSRFLVTMRDLQQGPYTSAHLRLIESAILQTHTVSTQQKAMYYLCRDWGLRPIQIALLSTEDLQVDKGGPFIMVPSVKGQKRSKLRRHPTNMKKRYISDDTKEALDAQCQEAEKTKKALSQRIDEICRDHSLPKAIISTPLFPSATRSTPRLLRFLQNPKIAKYAFHSDSCAISRQIINLTWMLAIHSSKPFGNEDEYLDITAYRFRRTKGSSMVLAGCTPEEVAEALDHQSIDSISHYFRFNSDLQSYINKVHLDSPTIRAAVDIWEGRFIEDEEVQPSYRSVAKLGKCSRTSACPYHPTVTCYACQNFKPSKKADHHLALEEIKAFQSMLGGLSTGAMTQQVEAAIYGAESILIAIKELQ